MKVSDSDDDLDKMMNLESNKDDKPISKSEPVGQILSLPKEILLLVGYLLHIIMWHAQFQLN